jgi:MFS family permease
VIIVFVEMVLIYSVEGKKRNTFFIRTGYFVCAVSFACLNLLPAGFATAIFAILLVTIGEMLSMPFMNSFWIQRSAAHNRGQYAALYAMAWSLAQIAAPLSGSRIAAAYSFTTLWWTLCCVCIAASAGIFLLEQSIKHAKLPAAVAA